VAGEEKGLGVGDEADGELLVEEWVGDLVALAFLVRFEDGAAPIVGEADAAGGFGLEVGRTELGAVEEAEGKPVGEEGAEFLHEVEGEAGSAGPVGVEEADGGIETDAFEGGLDIVGEEGVEEGEEGVDGVSWGSAVAAGEGESGFAGSDELGEHGEVELGGLALDAAELVGGGGLLKALDALGELGAGLPEGAGAIGLGAVAGGAVEGDAGVGDFAEDEEAGQVGGLLWLVGATVLGATEEDVAGDGALDPGEEAPILGEEADLHAVSGAVSQEERAAEDVAEADDAFEVVNRQAEAGLALDADQDGLAFLGQVGALGSDVESVEQFSHGGSSPFSVVV
jgi:hypothetical protein